MISSANLYSKEVGQEHSTQRVQISNSILIVWKTGCQITILSPFHRIFVKYCPRCWSNIFLSIDQIFASKYCDQILSEIFRIKKAHDRCTPPADFRVSCSQFKTDLCFYDCYGFIYWQLWMLPASSMIAKILKRLRAVYLQLLISEWLYL